MSTVWEMHSRVSNRDLHVRMEGHFHQAAAQELQQLLQHQYTGAGRVFFDVRTLQATEAQQHALFKQCVSALPAQQILYKGELGFQLAGNGSRVLIVKKGCGCKGGCKVCACKERIKKRDA